MTPNDSPNFEDISEPRQSELTWPDFLRAKAERRSETPTRTPKAAPRTVPSSLTTPVLTPMATPTELPYTGAETLLGLGAAGALLMAGGALRIAGRKAQR